MPSRPPSSPPSPPGSTAHAPDDAHNATAAAGSPGCLPADQSCFALPSGARGSTHHRDDAARACCTATSYVVVLGISFGSLFGILLALCAVRWYLVRRSVGRHADATAAPDDEKRPAGLDADAIAALPEFAYAREEEDGEEEEEVECAVCLGVMADGEAARRLPRCMHVFHRPCVDVWLRDHLTCPVCRTEVVFRPPGEGCADKDHEGRSASTSTVALPPEIRPMDHDGERDLEAQQ